MRKHELWRLAQTFAKYRSASIESREIHEVQPISYDLAEAWEQGYRDAVASLRRRIGKRGFDDDAVEAMRVSNVAREFIKPIK